MASRTATRGPTALAEKKTALADVKARLARYRERFERAANAGEEDRAWVPNTLSG